jgi:hypothetical protein
MFSLLGGLLAVGAGYIRYKLSIDLNYIKV